MGKKRTLRFHLGEYCIGRSGNRKWTTRKGIIRAPMAKGHATGTQQRQRMKSEKNKQVQTGSSRMRILMDTISMLAMGEQVYVHVLCTESRAG
jgi:hypothetical protein